MKKKTLKQQRVETERRLAAAELRVRELQEEIKNLQTLYGKGH